MIGVEHAEISQEPTPTRDEIITACRAGIQDMRIMNYIENVLLPAPKKRGRRVGTHPVATKIRYAVYEVENDIETHIGNFKTLPEICAHYGKSWPTIKKSERIIIRKI